MESSLSSFRPISGQHLTHFPNAFGPRFGYPFRTGNARKHKGNHRLPPLRPSKKGVNLLSVLVSRFDPLLGTHLDARKLSSYRTYKEAILEITKNQDILWISSRKSFSTNRFRITPLWIITSANTNKFQANRDTRSGLCAKSFMWPQHAPEVLRTLRVH